HHIGNAGRSGYMQQICVRSGSRKSGSQGILKHITASPGILSDHNLCLMLSSVIPAQKTSYLVRMLHGQLYIGLSAKSIGSKIFSHVLFLLLCRAKHAARTYHCHEAEKPSPDFRQRLSCYNSFRIVFYEYRGLVYTPSSTSRPMDSTTAARSS